MAGMLPGVECARRRRCHQKGDSPGVAAHGGSRRSTFCLYASHHESYHSSIPSLQRSILNKGRKDEKLGGAAGEAKERLDERLRAEKSESKRRSMTAGKSMGSNGGTGELPTEVFGGKKSGARKFEWSKLRWKANGQDECSICLEEFKAGETLVHLPCAHRFHTRCLVPWLENNARCPCCRMDIHVQFS